MTNWDYWEEGADREDYCQSIYELAKKFGCKTGLEIGVRFGKSALAFLRANEGSSLVGVDPNPEFPVQDFLDELTPKRFVLINNYSPKALSSLPKDTFDWIYIDGEHTEQAVLADFEAAWPLLKKGGVMVFDDYRKDQGYDTTVAEAVDEILDRLGKKYKTTADFGLHPNPHGAAVIVK